MIRRDPRRRRPGFTLIELLVVIVIIGILISLLLPAIISAVRKTHEAVVASEIQTLSAALGRFKDTYGEFPPSRVILSEQGFYTASPPASPSGLGTSVGPLTSDNSTALSAVAAGKWINGVVPTPAFGLGLPDISVGELASRSLRFLRKMFPRAALGPETSTGYYPDFNGNNNPDVGMIYLEGHECLVFFLGGIPNPALDGKGGITYGTSGFGKEPRYPFKNAGVGGTFISTANRNPAFFEFKTDRLVDLDGDGIPGYLDPNASGGTGHFYAYFAAYGAVGYDPNDVNFGDDGDFSNKTTFRIGLPAIKVDGTAAGNTVDSPSPNPYTSGLPTPIDTNGKFSLNQPASYINVNSFQIISSGADGLFGPGGQWTSNGERLPLPPSPPYTDQTAIRPLESDNITNFTTGRLNP